MTDGQTQSIELALWKQLRDEANSVKDCFTRFSFQALAFSAVMLGAVANYQPKQPLVGLVGVLVIVVVLTVSRIGGYKYSTANRHFAYELYCDSSAPQNGIGWEEASRAWRVVAPALFDALYVTPSDQQYGRIRRFVRWLTWGGQRNREQLESGIARRLAELKKTSGRTQVLEAQWFDPRAQVAPLEWHPGRYLEQMQGVLHLVATLALLPVVAMAVQLTPALVNELGFAADVAGAPVALSVLRTAVIPIIAWAVAVRTGTGLWIYARQLKARRTILENGMLSIPSSAIVWQATIEAHKLARRETADSPQLYVPHLAAVAGTIASRPLQLWDWLQDPEGETKRRVAVIAVVPTAENTRPAV